MYSTIQRVFILVVCLSLLGIWVVAQDSAPTSFPPANGQSAPAIGPITLIENIHATAPSFTSVLQNPTFAHPPLPILVNGRVIEVPPGWSYTGDPGIGGLPPYIARYEHPGLRFGWDYVAGKAGFAQDGIQLFGNQRYVVRVHYRTDLQQTQTNVPFTPSHLRMRGSIYTAQGGRTELPPQSMQGLQQEHTIEWVVESTTNPYPFIRLEVVHDMEWPIFIGYTFLERIDILTAPADYRPEYVIQFN